MGIEIDGSHSKYLVGGNSIPIFIPEKNVNDPFLSIAESGFTSRESKSRVRLKKKLIGHGMWDTRIMAKGENGRGRA